jgi:large subunit ribosomal protein L29
MSVKADRIRELSTQEILVRINDAREELLKLRFQQATGELMDHNRMRITRRQIARLMTILHERVYADEMEGEA